MCWHCEEDLGGARVRGEGGVIEKLHKLYHWNTIYPGLYAEGYLAKFEYASVGHGPWLRSTRAFIIIHILRCNETVQERILYLTMTEQTHRLSYQTLQKKDLFASDLLDDREDVIRSKTLRIDLLVQAAAALLDRTDRPELGRQLALQEVSSQTAAQAGLLRDRLDNQDEGRGAVDADGLLVDDVERGLVDQTHVEAFLAQALHRVQGPVQHVAVRDDVAGRTLADDLLLARDELVTLAEELLLGAFLQNVRHLGTGGEDEAHARLPEDLVHDGLHLLTVRGEVERGALRVHEAVVGEEVVQAEVAGVVGHLVDAAVREVRQHRAAVQTGHGDLRDAHLQERGEGGEHTLALAVAAKAEPGRGGEVASLHDTGGDEGFGVLGGDGLQTGGTSQVGVDDHHPAGGFFLAQLVEHAVHGLAEDGPARTLVLGRTQVLVRVRAALDLVVERELLRAVSALGQVLAGDFDVDHVVGMDLALDALDTGGHGAVHDHGSGTLVVDDVAHRAIQRVDVLALGADNVEAVAFQGSGDVKALQVLRRVSGDRDIVVVNEQLDVEVPGHSNACSLGVVSFLLGTIGTQHDDVLILVGHRDTVDHGPHVTETTGAELDTRREAQLGVARQLGVGVTVVQEMLRVDLAVHCGEKVLGCDTVARLVEESVDEAIGVGIDEGQKDADFRGRVEGTARVAGDTASGTSGGEGDDGISEDVDVVQEVVLLVGCESGIVGVKLEVLELLEINWELVPVCHVDGIVFLDQVECEKESWGSWRGETKENRIRGS